MKSQKPKPPNKKAEKVKAPQPSKKLNVPYVTKLRQAQANRKTTQTVWTWVHINCSFWVSPLVVGRQAKIYDTSEVAQIFFRFPVSWSELSCNTESMSVGCDFCDFNAFSPKIKCAVPECLHYFHGECARKNGIQLSIDDAKSTYCLYHQNELHKRQFDEFFKVKER